ncbi:hypothetical protein [Modestobacter marinus]|uniref:hypothetical protein n=1 Tax=Modestobacter marinus TaxID=477641 RepID=UPI001C976E6E|nr:hypothetical protein [Modestobacter marinus]
MSTPSGGPGSGPVEEPVTQSGRPPVPAPAPADDAARDPAPVHDTDPVPFPLPPVAPADEPATPRRKPAPDETGVLDLRAYPPRVPGRAARPSGAEDGEDGAGRGH